MSDYYVPKTAKELVRWLGIRQGKGASYYRKLKKRQLYALYYAEIDKHERGGK